MLQCSFKSSSRALACVARFTVWLSSKVMELLTGRGLPGGKINCSEDWPALDKMFKSLIGLLEHGTGTRAGQVRLSMLEVEVRMISDSFL